VKTTWAQLWSHEKKHSCKAMLFYGNDPDQLHQRVQQFACYVYPEYKKYELTSGEVVKSPELLNSLKAGDDLFSGNRETLVILSQATDKLLSMLCRKWEEGLNIPILINSSKLKKGSKLRSYFDTAKDLKIIPSYEPDQDGFKAQLKYISSKQGVSFCKNASELAGQQLAWNSSFLEMYIEKIKWLSLSKGIITEEDVWSCSIPLNPEMEVFLKSFFNKETKLLISTLKIWEEKQSIQNLYFFSFYLWKLLELKDIVSQGERPSQAVYRLRPVLPAHVNAMLLQGLEKWPKKTIRLIISKILKAERYIKLNQKQNFSFAQELLVFFNR